MVKKSACTAALLAAIPLASQAASLDYFLKIPGAAGESMDSKHKGEIDVLSWSWGVSTSGGQPSFEPFSWTQGLDSSFTPLFLGLVNDTAFTSAQLTVRRASGISPVEFFKMVFTGPHVIALNSQAGVDSIVVSAAMRYDAVTMTYCPTLATGALGTCVNGAFTLSPTKVLSFSGDPTVLRGLAEAGGTVDAVNLPVPVPEPATWATLLAGLGVLGVITVAQRRRRDGAETPQRVRA